MKKLLTLLIAICIVGLFSCAKEDLGETPGNIPGLGNAPGKPEIKEKFVLPDGITIEGEKIVGLAKANQQAPALKSSGGNIWTMFGSGQDVTLMLTLKNEGSAPRTLFLPKGLIWESLSGTYQHGLQIQTIWISLMPGATKTVTVHLYCANISLPTPDHNAAYRILGITSSRIIWRFLDLIGWKMVNYEMIVNDPSRVNNLKSGNGPSFHDISERMQRIIEKLTDNGEPISEDDKQFIESIPEISDPSIRAILDNDASYPEYMEEYRELINK